MNDSVTIAKRILNESPAGETNPDTIKKTDQAIKRLIAKEYHIPIGYLKPLKVNAFLDNLESESTIDLTKIAMKTAFIRLFRKVSLTITVTASLARQRVVVFFKYSYEHHSGGTNGHTDPVYFKYELDSRGGVKISQLR